jgi:uncharacterized protein HemY
MTKEFAGVDECLALLGGRSTLGKGEWLNAVRFLNVACANEQAIQDTLATSSSLKRHRGGLPIDAERKERKQEL